LLIFGLRELTPTEMTLYCSNSSQGDIPIINDVSSFTSNYELRIYMSGCYYLDQDNNWQSNGLLVGPKTNHYQTQCFSTHLTTFTAAFRVLTESTNWDFLFANDQKDIQSKSNVGFEKNEKTLFYLIFS
jgi:hypothetical protein